MKKLRLMLDELRVDSFATDGLAQEAGTVRAHESLLRCTETCDTGDFTCDGGGNTCDDANSCQISCSDCNSYYCATGGVSCGRLSCVYTCAVGC
ncbi:MAG TPA: hypothetical protein VF092_23330 [Longimicrobium sp.]